MSCRCVSSQALISQRWSLSTRQGIFLSRVLGPRPAQNPNTDAESVDQGGSYRYRGYAANNAFHPGRYFRTNQSYQQRRWPGTFGQNQRGPGAQYPVGQSDGASGPGGQFHQKPKVITIVRNGPKPRSNVKILLNRRSVQSYEQLVTDISEAFGPKHRHAKIRKLFSVRGKEVHGISDFFRDDDCFIAVSVGEANPSDADVGELLEELFPEGNYAKVFQREWEKNQRRSRRSVAGSLKSNRDAVNTNATKYSSSNDNNNNANLQTGSHVPDKRDSGFDSSDASTNRSEPDGPSGAVTDRRGAQHRPRRKMWRGEPEGGVNNNNTAPSEAGTCSPQQPQQQGYYLLKKMEKERMKVANEERERAKRRAQKMVEAERRAAEEEKRKRGLVPVRNMDNPFKRVEDPRDKEREEAVRRKKEEERRRREEERLEQEKKEREREEREQAEKAARERMAQAEQKEKESQDKEKERMEQEERERKKKEKEERAQRKADKPGKAKEAPPPVQSETSPAPKPDAQTKDTERDMDTSAAAVPAVAESANNEAKEDLDITDGPNTTVPAATAPPVAKDNGNTRQQQKEKRRQEREEKQQRKRAKTKIVRKTKEERQVSSDDFIFERYDLGRKLGDGNFAVVRQSRKKETGQEFAVKVIDKAKLKGKEHMVENEIDIMKDCNHTNIVRLFEEYETAERIYLVMELVKGGDLFDAITQSVKFGEPESALMVKDLCNALYYMHSRSIVHRDLKPENLLVHRNKDGSITLKLADFGLAMEVKELIYTVCGTPTYVAPEILTEIDLKAPKLGFPPSPHPLSCRNQILKTLCVCLLAQVHRNKDGSITLKLADFGLAMEVKELIYTVCGTPTYVAPEILTEIGYGLEVDMWAVGVITYILLCGFPPFRSPDRNQTELFEFIKAGEYEFLSPYWDSTSRSAKDLISRLLIVDRRKRYTSVDVLSHRWVVSCGQPDLLPAGAANLDGACKKVRRELEEQAKVNYDSYQRLKAEKKRERIKGEE
ncbi:serine/threonine-protein kinase dclk3 [Plakobranchus ocellatus]|uniref:non-specific serine/threonine protein kinase n=1 Tax=Plakobranchus ocellatus TaxID=259542 RepID=A0AAV4A0P5_9GAST|nr:serine/threonine-protein kinase dclk3 [Plakobranchus ocellatus]